MAPGIRYAAKEAERVAQQNAGKWFKVSLKKSLIGLHWKTRECAERFGLRRVGQQIYRPINGAVIGSIVKLKELVRVQIKKGLPLPNNRKHPCGFEVVGNMMNKNSPI